MANEEHVAKLKEGVNVWNDWRGRFPEIIPDLEEANLEKADLKGFNLSEANLKKANLGGAFLTKCNLQEADLREADLTGAKLESANLREAKLREAKLEGADLYEARIWHIEGLPDEILGVYIIDLMRSQED